MRLNLEEHRVVRALPVQLCTEKVILLFRRPGSQSAQRQTDGFRGIGLGDDAHKDILPGKSCDSEGISLGIEKLHAAPAQSRMGLFQAAKGAVQLIVDTPLEILLPGHGVAAALVGIRGAVDLRLVPIVDGGCAGEQKLEAGRTLEVRLGDFGVIVQPWGIVAVEEVKLGLPQGEGELGQVLHNPHLQILGGHVARDGL